MTLASIVCQPVLSIENCDPKLNNLTNDLETMSA